MPGIYIDPASGSAITSTLGNILGGMATNMDPKTAAEAQELRTRTIGEDLANQKLKGIIAGATGLPGIVGSANAEPAPPAGGVAGTLAGAAVPPDTGPAPGTFGGGAVNAGYAPMARVIAGSYLNDPSMANVTTGINLGKDITTGPGSDFTTQGEIVKTKAIPYDTSPGVTHHVPGGALPETITSGGDPAQLEAQKAQLASAQKDADMRAQLADTATNTQSDLVQAKNLYNSLIGVTDARSVLSDGIIAKLAARTGFSVDQLSDAAMARLAIKSILKSSISSSLAAVQGDQSSPVIRGALQQTNDSLPDPDKMNDVQFNAGIDRMLKITARQQQQGAPARAFQKSAHAKADADAYYTGLEALRAQQEAENAKEATSGGGEFGAGGQVYVFPDEATMEAAGTAGNLPDGARVQIGYGPKALSGKYKK